MQLYLRISRSIYIVVQIYKGTITLQRAMHPNVTYCTFIDNGLKPPYTLNVCILYYLLTGRITSHTILYTYREVNDEYQWFPCIRINNCEVLFFWILTTKLHFDKTTVTFPSITTTICDNKIRF